MNRLIEIHDSTFSGIEVVGCDVVLLLAPAYVHCSDGRPGVDPGSGWQQEVAVLIGGAVVESSPSGLPCWLSHGSFSVGDAVVENGIPFPFVSSEPVSLRAVTESGELLIVRGNRAEVVARGEPRYIESFPGATE